MIRTIHGVYISLVSVLLLYFVCVPGVLQDIPEKKQLSYYTPNHRRTPTSAIVTFLCTQAGHSGEVSPHLIFLF